MFSARKLLVALMVMLYAAGGAMADCDSPSLTYDDGTYENGYPNPLNNLTYAMLFEPPNIGAVYESLCISLAQDNAGTDTELNFTVVVYEDDGGQPGASVKTKAATATNVPAYPTFATYEVDLLSFGLGGHNYFIGIQWNGVTNPGFRLAADESPGTTLQPGFGSNNNGGSWLALTANFTSYRSLGLRVNSQQQAFELCSDNSVFGQRSPLLVEPMNGDISDGGDRVADNFSGILAPITRVTWWAGGANFISQPCQPDSDEWTVNFYDYNAGTPGTLLSSQTVVPTITATGREYGANEYDEYKFNAILPTPVSYFEGWVSVAATGGTLCYHYWLNSPEGDSIAYERSGGSWVAQTRDQAFCLSTVGAYLTLDGDDSGSLSLDELLRAIQFYNADGYHCDAGTNDGYAPGAGDQASCDPLNSDYDGDDWTLGLSELLRLVQVFSSLNYSACPGMGTEDGFCVN